MSRLARRAAAVLLVLAMCGGAASADEAAERMARARAHAQKLVAGPDEAAKRALYDMGRDALAVLGEELGRVEDPFAHARLAEVLEAVLKARLSDLDGRIGTIEQQRRDKEVEGSPVDSQSEAGVAANALLLEIRAAGPAASRELSRPGAAREMTAQLARAVLLDDQARLLFDQVEAADAQEVADLAGQLARMGPLAAPLLAAILDAKEAPEAAKAVARKARDAAVTRGLGLLDSAEAPLRDAGESWLLGLGDLAQGGLEAYAARASADGAHRARRILQWSRWAMTPELYGKLGHALEGYDAADWRAKRLLVFEVEKQGGAEAIPTLRRVLEREPSLAVKLVAAEGLARLGDPRGQLFLIETRGEGLLQQAPEVLAAIALDQGIKYLQIQRYDRAVAEFERVLEIEPKSELALYNLACAYALMGEKDKAFDHLERSIKAGFHDLEHMRKDPDLKTLREDPRWERMELEVGGAGGTK